MNKLAQINKAFGSWVSILALIAIVISVNAILRNFRLRADLTADRLYTLNEGTENILRNLSRPVTLKFFFNHSSPAVPVHLKNYARRVEDLLKEYKLIAGDMLTLEFHDPEPDSDAEEWARRYGLQGQAVEMFGPQVFCGLVAVAGDIEGALPLLDPQGEELLEYNISRLILRVLSPEQPVVGVIGALPVMGRRQEQFPMPNQPQAESQPWLFIQHLQNDYRFRRIEPGTDRIDPQTDLLLVMHPRELPPETVYAIDQFVLSGKPAIIMVDPLSAAKAQHAEMGPMGMQQITSNLPDLFAAWGIGYEPGQVVADPDISATFMNQQQQPEISYIDLLIERQGMNDEEIALAKLQNLRFPFAGALRDKTDENLTFTPLVRTTSNAGTVSAMTAQFGGQAIRSEYRSGGAPLAIAARIAGQFTTAFPDGPPDSFLDDEDSLDLGLPEGHLATGKGAIIIIADTDFLFDPVAVRAERNIFGQVFHRAVNDNITLFVNLLEQMTGGSDLIAIRSRKRTNRPFEKVLDLERKAIDAWQQQEQALEQRLHETQQRINEMQAGREDQQDFLVLTPEQVEAIEHFRQEEAAIKRELRNVRRNLRKDIERLGIKVKAINIGLMPLLVAITGIGFGIYRRR